MAFTCAIMQNQLEHAGDTQGTICGVCFAVWLAYVPSNIAQARERKVHARGGCEGVLCIMLECILHNGGGAWRARGERACPAHGASEAQWLRIPGPR